MQKLFFKMSTLLLLAIGITACAGRTDYAPVTDVNMIDPLPKNGIYRVGAGETLYSIAWRYGLDYRDLAERNHLAPPFHVQKGQIIYLKQNAPAQVIKPIKQAAPRVISKPKPIVPRVSVREREPNKIISVWSWPSYGPIINGFSSTNKGINIGGSPGSPIYTTAAGKVVYSGHGLRGYGNLIIIKHNSKFLSAYAHNKKLLVKEGDWVVNNQKIAEMGSTGARTTMLHFEIRRDGKPVNPLIYLNRSR